MAIVIGYLDMLPTLTAEESLRGSARVALGSGSLKQRDAMELHQKWARQAERGTQRRTARGRGSA
jgi:hypothetical protein